MTLRLAANLLYWPWIRATAGLPVMCARPRRRVDTLFWMAVGFLSGSIPFSVWLGRLLLRADIRRYGDGNPGAANAWRAGGWPLGLLVGLLDNLKGEVPIILGALPGIGFLTLATDAYSVMASMVGVLAHLLLRGHPPFLIAVWIGNMLVLVWKHRADLRQKPRLRPWLRRP